MVVVEADEGDDHNLSRGPPSTVSEEQIEPTAAAAAAEEEEEEKEEEDQEAERAQPAHSMDFRDDHTEDKTYGRQIAVWLARNFPVLYGIPPSPYKPSIETAWAFFEHVSLERYIVDENDAKLAAARSLTTAPSMSKRERIKRTFNKGERKLHIAEPGEREFHTHLYSPINTPLSQLGDFGLGFGIYFATVRDFAFLALLGGLLSIPNIVYFASNEYSQGQEGLPSLQKGSAICTDRSWVPCPTCTPDVFNDVAEGAYNVDRFVQKWDVLRNEQGRGFYLNVTDYLNWTDPNALITTENGVTSLHGLIGTSIPASSRIVLEAGDGYMLDGVNVTAQLGYTPLWCSYLGMSDCYIDLYPFLVGKDIFGTDRNELWAQVVKQRQGDSDFIQTGFAWKNNCGGATQQQGFINYGVVLIMLLGTIYVWFRVNRMEAKFDEDEQTAQDYSVVVRNPPPDAFDPTEWKDFFERALQLDKDGGCNNISNTAVTVCTVDVDNEVVIKFLFKRREILRSIQLALPPDSPLDRPTLEREAQKAALEKPACGLAKLPAMLKRLQDVENQIKDFFKTVQQPPTTRVYLTFETEAAQRQVLAQSAVGVLEASNNTEGAVPKHYLFRDKYVLQVREPDEPSAIRWQELNATPFTIYLRKFITSAVTFAFAVVAYFIIRALYKQNLPWFASIVTTIFTSMFGTVAKLLMKFEKHETETSRQKWLFLKIAAFNILVTTVLLALITPFQATLDQQEYSLPGLIPAVNKLFWSQLTIAPVLQVLDIGGNIKRHVMAPRATTQEEMNMCMRGTPVLLAERYAHLMKFLFMTLWYCSIYPGVLFMGAFALIITYFVDRFSLMRSWARSPQVGAEIADFARNFFTPVAMCLMSVVSAYFWSGFPYDNLCLDEDVLLPANYIGDFDLNVKAYNYTVYGVNLYQGVGIRAQFSVAPDAEVYKFCNQDLRALSGFSFPALPEFQPWGGEWMTPEQEDVVSAQGWTSLIVLVAVVLSILAAIVSMIRHRCISGSHAPRGEDQKIAFSDVPAIDSYIPQMTSPLLTYPLLMCDIQDIDKSLFNWEDSEKPHSHYDVTNDVVELLGTNDFPKVFAKVKHWPKIKTKTEQAQVAPDKESKTEAEQFQKDEGGDNIAKETEQAQEAQGGENTNKKTPLVIMGQKIIDEVSV